MQHKTFTLQVCLSVCLSQSRVPGAPVVVVATHADQLSSHKRTDTIKQLSATFKSLYLSSKHSHHAYPNIHPKCYFVSCIDGSQIGTLRDVVYEVAMSIRALGNWGEGSAR